jgi:hypothetical protein
VVSVNTGSADGLREDQGVIAFDEVNQGIETFVEHLTVALVRHRFPDRG